VKGRKGRLDRQTCANPASDASFRHCGSFLGQHLTLTEVCDLQSRFLHVLARQQHIFRLFHCVFLLCDSGISVVPRPGFGIRLFLSLRGQISLWPGLSIDLDLCIFLHVSSSLSSLHQINACMNIYIYVYVYEHLDVSVDNVFRM
jgi:hypothetical protein